MRVVLVRHGQPAGISPAPISGRAIGVWLRAYNAAGIRIDRVPPGSLRELASSTRYIVASDARRAQESAAWLAGSNIHLDADLREAPLPESLPAGVKLPPGIWIVAARLGWWLNCCEAAETISATRNRAQRVADRLAALAVEHGSVMAVGHGMFNRFIARELRRTGWRGPRALPTGYWGVAEFERPSKPR